MIKKIIFIVIALIEYNNYAMQQPLITNDDYDKKKDCSWYEVALQLARAVKQREVVWEYKSQYQRLYNGYYNDNISKIALTNIMSRDKLTAAAWLALMEERDKEIVAQHLFHWAAENGQEDTLKFLVDTILTLDINKPNLVNMTALHNAYKKGHYAIVKYLLDRGADTTIIIDDSSMITAFSYARNNHDTELEKILMTWQGKKELKKSPPKKRFSKFSKKRKV